MGATSFSTVSAGKSAESAYDTAVRDARYWNGHGGYTGTIAEKDGFVEFTLPARVTGERFEQTVWAALDESWQTEGARQRGEKAPRTPNLATLEKWLGKRDAGRILEVATEKWGPAVAVRLGPTEGDKHIPKTPTGKKKAGYGAWLFFGMASC